jgi:hypothetical protein
MIPWQNNELNFIFEDLILSSNFYEGVDASAVLPITINTARGDAHDYVIQ